MKRKPAKEKTPEYPIAIATEKAYQIYKTKDTGGNVGWVVEVVECNVVSRKRIKQPDLFDSALGTLIREVSP